ncbi:MAG: energy transducer TonB [Nannocystaceae bacterium]|nr:energy transducer TonB [Nannocystaceae bacterium]
MPRRQDNDHLPIVAGMIVVSVLLHVVLWPVGNKLLSLTWSGGAVSQPDSVMEVALIAPPSEDEAIVLEPDEVRPPERDEKIVQLDRVVDERPPERTPHRSEFDNRVEHETKAPNRPPRPGQAPQVAGQPKVQPRETSQQPPPETSAKSLNLDARGTSDAAAGHTVDEARAAELARGQERGQGVAPPPRAGMLGSADALRKTFGRPGTYDSLKDIDEGDENLLNSRRYKYASFFNRVRNSVAQHWKPVAVHRAHDPEGRIFGAKTRRTKLVIRLNADGSLAKIMIAQASDAAHLDEEAIRAVRQAAPFDNPPTGLVDPDTGFIEFGFGFVFELRGKNRIFRYQR